MEQFPCIESAEGLPSGDGACTEKGTCAWLAHPQRAYADNWCRCASVVASATRMCAFPALRARTYRLRLRLPVKYNSRRISRITVSTLPGAYPHCRLCGQVGAEATIRMTSTISSRIVSDTGNSSPTVPFRGSPRSISPAAENVPPYGALLGMPLPHLQWTTSDNPPYRDTWQR